MEVCTTKKTDSFRNQNRNNFIQVPIAMLDGLSSQIETLQHSLAMKQCQLGEVIRRQEEQILLHKEKILQMGQENFQKLSLPAIPLHEESDDFFTESESQEGEAQSTDENSDSFVTISDGSFSDSDLSTTAQSPSQEEVIEMRPVLERCSFQVNPLFDSTGLLEWEEAGDTEEMERVLIGDPEKLMDSAFKRMSCRPRQASMFRATAKGSLGRMSRWSKSEGNITQLIDKNPKAFFGGSFKNLFKPPVVRSPRSQMIWESGDRQLVSTFKSINTRRPTGSSQPRSKENHFSSLLGFDGSWAGPVSTSNHKTVRRPRDVKLRSRLRSQTVTVVAEKYRINYCFC